MNVNEIFKKFGLDEEVMEYGDGHINNTYLSQSKKYILQKINTNVFKNPDGLMENIINVTEFIKEKLKKDGKDYKRGTLRFVKTTEGKNYYLTPDGEAYRVYKFVDGTSTISVVTDLSQLYKAAKGFGEFAKMLDDYPAQTLHEVIPDFHNTPKRYENFLKAVEDNLSGRADSAKEEIDFVIENKGFISAVVDGIEDGSIPLRVTHNDTKINNILFDEETGEAVCVIDLDTVMPGSLLYDFGDALRIGAATAAEDEKDLDKVWFNVDAFEAFTKGYVEVMGPYMTEKEIELLPLSVKLLTYECGSRFLADYLNGDTYFKTQYPEHNLVRARTQFKLIRDMEEKMPEMKKIVSEAVKNCK